MKATKLKMSGKKFRMICAPITALVLVLALVLSLVTNYYRVALNNYVGKGSQVIKAASGTEAWDTNYYDQQYSSIQEARETNSANVALSIAEEGITLLKNNDALPLSKGDSITPYGLRYLDPLYGGTGSGNVDVSMDYIDTAEEVMNEYFTIDSTVASKLAAATHYYLAAPDADGTTSGWSTQEPNTGSSTMFVNHSWLDEYNPDEVYDDEFKAASQGTTAIVFLGRVGGESNDLYYGQNGAYADGSEHELQLSDYEKETIRVAKANSDKVVVVLESSNVMEISELAAEEGDLAVDAIVWMGGAGAKGFRGLAEVLTGEVNPSGHLPDTWMSSILDDPTSSNFGENLYSNLSYEGITQALVEYDEGIYMGYRYYETVNDLNGEFTVNGSTVGYGELDENGNLTESGAVVYPFGYGLSYGTDFDQKIQSVKEDGNDVTVEVKVTNNGTQAGKDVVQLYYGAPYTALDVEYGIEKSTVNLMAYDKTEDIAPGASVTVTLTFSKEDMASYSETHENSDGTVGCYMLEEGDYAISIRANSHDVYDSATVTVDSTIWYDGSDDAHVRQSEKDAQDTAGGSETGAEEYIAATNQFQDSVDHMAAKSDTLTRASGKLVNTAQAPTDEDKIADDDMLAAVDTLAYFDPETDEEMGNGENSKVYAPEAPTTNVDSGLTVADMRGVAWDDPKWDTFLDQLDLSSNSDVYTALLSGCYTVSEITSVGKPSTSETDGPQGISTMFGDPNDGGCAWCSAPILAATFNTDLAYEMGAAVGQEAMANNESAWYAPGMDTHRSPFSGRNFEYYSEDPILAGNLAASVVSGAADNGVSCVIKHLFLNDMETNRNHINTWCSEQAMREIYLKTFEIAIKDATTELKYIADENGTVATKTIRACTGIMTSMGSIGTSYCGTNYNLVTNVLRGEMGFRGMIMTDMAENSNNSRDLMLRAGVDEYMWMTAATSADLKDSTSATSQTATRNAVKDMCYMVANNSSLQGVAPGAKITYTLSNWQMGVIAGDVVLGVIALALILAMVKRSKDEKLHPENYKK
jgi:beta-glucosidase